MLAPRETAALALPKRATRELRPYLAASPLIDVNDRRIRAAVTEALKPVAGLAASDVTDWHRVEALYDYATAHVAYELGDDKSSIQALADGRGDCQAIAATFVAMCRTLKTPARMVWADGHQYAEFYLESAPGRGAWYPVESAGTRSVWRDAAGADHPAEGRQHPRAGAARRIAAIRLRLCRVPAAAARRADGYVRAREVAVSGAGHAISGRGWRVRLWVRRAR